MNSSAAPKKNLANNKTLEKSDAIKEDFEVPIEKQYKRFKGDANHKNNFQDNKNTPQAGEKDICEGCGDTFVRLKKHADYQVSCKV